MLVRPDLASVHTDSAPVSLINLFDVDVAEKSLLQRLWGFPERGQDFLGAGNRCPPYPSSG
jgi:hypothetical protein